jgi:hypothetical protein
MWVLTRFILVLDIFRKLRPVVTLLHAIKIGSNSAIESLSNVYLGCERTYVVLHYPCWRNSRRFVGNVALNGLFWVTGHFSSYNGQHLYFVSVVSEVGTT